MELETAVIVAAIAVAFMLFAAVLAWGDAQTRHLAEK
jgi:hypothetical protein